MLNCLHGSFDVSASDCSRHHILSRELLSNLAEVDGFCLETRNLLTSLGLLSQLFPVEMLLRESLNNAIIHGNCCDCQKKMHVEVRIGRKWIILRVTDEGAGFDSRRAIREFPASDATSGRGLAIYSLYADRVSFNSKGNRVCFWRARTGEGKA